MVTCTVPLSNVSWSAAGVAAALYSGQGGGGGDWRDSSGQYLPDPDGRDVRPPQRQVAVPARLSATCVVVLSHGAAQLHLRDGRNSQQPHRGPHMAL